MYKSFEDAIAMIERMTLSDHKRKYNRGPTQNKSGIIEWNTYDAILEKNKLLTGTMDELAKQLSMLPQQIKDIHKIPKHMHIAYYESCSRDHLTGFCPPTEEELNYVNSQQRP